MIIIEFIWKIAAWVLFKIIRFCLWIFAAKNCKHCKYGYKNYWNRLVCSRGWEDCGKCRAHPCYPFFERKDKPKGFFDIL